MGVKISSEDKTVSEMYKKKKDDKKEDKKEDKKVDKKEEKKEEPPANKPKTKISMLLNNEINENEESHDKFDKGGKKGKGKKKKFVDFNIHNFDLDKDFPKFKKQYFKFNEIYNFLFL